MVVGLLLTTSAVLSNVDYTTVTYGTQTEFEVIENGQFKSPAYLPYQNGDQFSIERKDQMIIYKQNGYTVYTSGALCTGDIVVRVKIKNPNG